MALWAARGLCRISMRCGKIKIPGGPDENRQAYGHKRGCYRIVNAYSWHFPKIAAANGTNYMTLYYTKAKCPAFSYAVCQKWLKMEENTLQL